MLRTENNLLSQEDGDDVINSTNLILIQLLQILETECLSNFLIAAGDYNYTYEDVISLVLSANIMMFSFYGWAQYFCSLK